MEIQNIDPQNYPFIRLQSVVETFGHSTKWTNQWKFNKSFQSCQAVRKHLQWGTSVINSPMSPPSLWRNIIISRAAVTS